MEPVDRIFELADAQFNEQRDFAKAIGVDPSIVSQWRTGVTKSYEKRLRLNKIASILGTTTDYLLTGEKKEPITVSSDELFSPDVLDMLKQLTPASMQEVERYIRFRAEQQEKL